MIELHPHTLIQLGTFDELELATFPRKVVNANPIIELPAAAQMHLGLNGVSCAPARTYGLRSLR